jgi:hypothetical protein
MSTVAAGLNRIKQWLDGPLGAVLGGSLYGSWATFANWMLGLQAALRIGCAHFLMSAAITWGSVGLMQRLFVRARTPDGGALLACTGTLAMTYGVLVSAHLWLGTHDILLTLLPGILPTVGFSLFYSWLLRREALQGSTRRSHAGT